MERRVRKISLFLLLVAVLAWMIAPARAQKQKTLDIYSIDVEGGKATLFVAPSGETMLTDAGIPGPAIRAGLSRPPVALGSNKSTTCS
jgi:hypothetical protein